MNRTEHLLTILAEECNEVAQRCSKALRFGLGEIEPGQNFTNNTRIAHEMADLLGVWNLLQDEYILSKVDVYRLEDKKAKVLKFLEYSKQCGTLSEN